LERREFQDNLSLQLDEYDPQFRGTGIAGNNMSRGPATPAHSWLISQMKLLAQELTWRARPASWRDAYSSAMVIGAVTNPSGRRRDTSRED